MERVAQEGYVGTATEPESLAHLGRLVGYRPRPPLGAGGYLAYTLDPDARAVVPAGSQVKSVPAQGQLPQTFETSEDLLADAQWNTLSVRLTAPHRLDPQTSQDLNQLTLAGAALNLRAGDRMLLLFGVGQAPAVRVVAGGTPDFALGRTVATLVPVAATELLENARTALAAALETAPAVASACPLREAVQAAADQISSDGPAATDVYAALADASRLIAEGLAFVPTTAGGAVSTWAQGDVVAAAQAVAAALSAVAAQQRRSLPQVEYLRDLAAALACPDREARARGREAGCDRAAALVATASVLPALRRPPSHPPTAARYLAAGLGDFFDPSSDAVPGLLAAADPRLSDGIHQAWLTQQIAPPPAASGVQVLRIKARPLTPPPEDVVIGAAPASDPDPLYLEGALDGVLPGSWLVTEQRGSGHGPYRVLVLSMAQTRLAVPAPAGAPRVTVPASVVTVDGPWHDDAGSDHVVPYDEITVWAGGDDLTLAGDPITDDVAGSRIELAQVYTGLKPGRRLVVSGERTDIPGTTGVMGSELTMLAGVQQSVDSARGGDTVHPVLILAVPLAYTYKRDTVRIDGNVVPATQGETRSEVLGSGDAGRAGQSFALRQVSPTTPLTYLPSDTAGGADAALTVRVDTVRWHPSDDLTLLGPLDHGYLLTEDTGTATVTFGDGGHGARLTTGVENVTATYRVGAGSPGNLPPGRITQLVSRPLGVNAVTNPLASTGGTDADGPRDVRAGLPLRMHALDRLLSVRDYADFSRSRPGIGRTAAARLYDGVREVVHVTVAAADDVPADVSDPLLGNLAAALADFGDPHTAVRVDVRELVVLVLSAGIRVLPDYSFDTVRAGRAGLAPGHTRVRRTRPRPARVPERGTGGHAGRSRSGLRGRGRLHRNQRDRGSSPAGGPGRRAAGRARGRRGTARARRPRRAHGGHRPDRAPRHADLDRAPLRGERRRSRPPQPCAALGAAAPGAARRRVLGHPAGPARRAVRRPARDADPEENPVTDGDGPTLNDLLPALYRRRDADLGSPLEALLGVIEEQRALVRDAIEQQYADWFAETCQPWVLPYLGALVGYDALPGYAEVLARGDEDALGLLAAIAPRRDVARTVANRRRKGTLAVLEDLARDVAGWLARAVEFRRSLGFDQPVRRMPAHPADIAARLRHGQLADLRRGDDLDLVDGPFDRLAHTVDVRRVESVHPPGGRYGIASAGLFAWRLSPYPITLAPAYCEDRDRTHYTFSILGNDTPLVTKAVLEPAPTHIADETNVPAFHPPARLRGADGALLRAGQEPVHLPRGRETGPAVRDRASGPVRVGVRAAARVRGHRPAARPHRLPVPDGPGRRCLGQLPLRVLRPAGRR